jgi:hypothetical protein
MVLPDRIELSTSPLPRECSTTELRQHGRRKNIGRKKPLQAAVLATSPPLAQARAQASVPNPKFASFCGKLFCELRIRKDTGNL